MSGCIPTVGSLVTVNFMTKKQSVLVLSVGKGYFLGQHNNGLKQKFKLSDLVN